MTKEEIIKRSNEKLARVAMTLKELHLEPKAKQRINKDGFIECVIVYNDLEEYQVDEPEGAVVRKPEEGEPLKVNESENEKSV